MGKVQLQCVGCVPTPGGALSTAASSLSRVPRVPSPPGINPTADATSIRNFFAAAGIVAEWIPVHSNNCNERTRDPECGAAAAYCCPLPRVCS